jgi:hypothetical protein
MPLRRIAAFCLFVIVAFTPAQDAKSKKAKGKAKDEPKQLAIDPADFEFFPKVIHPPEAVKAERDAWIKKLKDKYLRKEVAVKGRLGGPPRYRDCDFSIGLVKTERIRWAGKIIEQEKRVGSISISVKLEERGFVLTEDHLKGPQRRIVGLFSEMDIPQSIVKIIDAKFAD